MSSTLNVYGDPIEPCCFDPLTGYFRDGYCRTNESDTGTHIICCVVTKEFLNFTKSKGNDLSSPLPFYNFPGLKPGDKWCLCISRWIEAEKEGFAPKVVLASTHQKVLQYTTLKKLKAYSV